MTEKRAVSPNDLLNQAQSTISPTEQSSQYQQQLEEQIKQKHSQLQSKSGSLHRQNSHQAPGNILDSAKEAKLSKLKALNGRDGQPTPTDLALSSLKCPSPPPILNTRISTGNNVSSNSINDIIHSEFKPSDGKQVPSSEQQQGEHNEQTQHPKQNESYQELQHPKPTGVTIDDPHSRLINSPSNSSFKNTVPAGGALLRGRAAATAVVAAVAAATARDRIRSESPNTGGPSSSSNCSSANNQKSATPQPIILDRGSSNSSPQGAPFHAAQSDSSINSPIEGSNYQHQNYLKSPDMHAHFYVEDTIRHGGVRSRSNSGSTTNESRNIREVMEGGNGNNITNTSNSGTVGIGIESSNGLPLLNKSTSSLGQPQSIPGKKEATPNVDPRLPQDDGRLHILFGACGSIASGKIKLIVKKLEEIYGKDKISIQLILTSAAEHFVSRNDFSTNVTIWRDRDEWGTWKNRTDPVLHIELRRWADILIVAPLTANTLSKIGLGLCDNLLTNVIRAWNTQYPILLAPSMVTYAYNSAPTKRHLKTIKEEMPWIEVLKPVEKIIGINGDIGMGGMMDYNEIVDKVVHKLGGYPDEDDDDDDNNEDDDIRDSSRHWITV